MGAPAQAAFAALVCLLIAAPVQAGHVRANRATPIRLALVPAYSECTAPNRAHGPPLAYASCNPPARESAEATMGTPEAHGGAPNFTGYVRFWQFGGAPGPPDDQELGIEESLSDVRCAPGGSTCGSANASGPADYLGEVRFAWTLRITDHWNGTTSLGGNEAATTVDIPIAHSIPCAETASSSTGSTCSIETLIDAFIPGAAKDDKRSVWEFGNVEVHDGGADGDGDTTADNTVFLRPGVYIP